MNPNKIVENLKNKAKDIRLTILNMVYQAGCGHTGGSLSEADILTALFFNIMNVDPSNPDKADRDRFILSKGHATPGYYSTLAVRGFFPLTMLDEFDRMDGRLQAHPDMHKVPGVDMSSGSLGQGLSCGIGMAMGGEAKKNPFYTYVLMGDGESAEGQIWEAALFAGAKNKKIKRIIAIVDYNKVQLASRTEEAVDLGDIAEKYRSFGWTAYECDGHNMEELVDTFEKAKKSSDEGPVAVIAHTVKGKGVSFMEGQFKWHGAAPNTEQYIAAVKEVEEA
jgi:transketolase